VEILNARFSSELSVPQQERLVIKAIMKRFGMYRYCGNMRSAMILWKLMIEELSEGFRDCIEGINVSVPPQQVFCSYLIATFGNCNLGRGGMWPGGRRVALNGMADYNNSLESSVHGGLKAISGRTRPNVPCAIVQRGNPGDSNESRF